MIRNYLKIAIRTLRRQPGYSAINIAGLSIGLACCILIGLFVQYERSFDEFHRLGDRMYRLNKLVTPQEGAEEVHAITGGAMGPAIQAAFPEVEQSLRMLPWFDDVMMRHEQTNQRVADVVFADSNFFSVFDFELVRGDPRTVLTAPRSIVFTEETAQRLFGDVDPMGKTVVGLNGLEYTVAGITKAPPATSHLRFNALISWTTTLQGEGNLNFGWLNRWLTQVAYTYLVLQPGADPGQLESKLTALMEEHLPERADQYHLYLQPFNDLYLHSSDILFTRGLRLGSAGYVNVFGVVGLLILAIACFNFINLTTARSIRRAREVGVRKVMGAHRPQLARQFLAESTLLVGLSLLLAVVGVFFVLPAFGVFTGRELRFEAFLSPSLLVALVGLMIVVGLGAGGYPAFVLSRFMPIEALKRQRAAGAGRAAPRKVLVAAQFAASIVLIVGTLVIYRQMDFVREADPGFEREHILVLPTGETAIRNQFEAFKQEVLSHPNVVQAAGSNSIPGSRGDMSSFNLRPEGKSDDETWEAVVWRVDDFDLVDTYDMKLAAGRYFSPAFATDSSSSVVINQALADRLGWSDPVGRQLDIPGEIEGSRVIGVLEDFHFESLHHEIFPLILYVAPRYENLSIRLKGEDITETLSFLEATWKRFEQVYPFEYGFLEEASARYYDAEVRLMQTLGIFAGLAIFVACLGLLGLAAFTVQLRTKEIGVRKLLGASVPQITSLLSRDFLTLVLIAFVAAVPIGYYAMNRWLEGFAYRIELDVWVFALAGLIAIAVAGLTVSMQAIRAALSNPVDALRYE